MCISEDEVAQWEEHLMDPWYVGKLRRFQSFIFDIFEDQRLLSDRHLIRYVQPRPEVKSIKSVVSKINTKRKEKPDYDFGSIEDLVGITVVCPYTSCAMEVIDEMFLQLPFIVKPRTSGEAMRTSDAGYRGWHFVAEPSPELITVMPFLMGAKCEIQIKTMIQEAWDAQTHDVTYKHEEPIDVGLASALKNQSASLAAHDDQSETIRSMIQKLEEEEKEHRCIAAATYLYLSISSGIFDCFREYCNLDLELERAEIFPLSRTDMARVNGFINCYMREKHVNKDLIKFVGYVALKQGTIAQERMALALAQEFLTTNPQNPTAEDAIAGFYWALSRFEEAIKHGNAAVKNAKRMGDDVSHYQDNCCYWVADAVLAKRAVKEDVKTQAFECSDQLSHDHPDDPKYLDTAAFVKIVLGPTVEDVKSGMKLLIRARDLAISTHDENTLKIFHVFNERHEKLAKARLAKEEQ